MVWTIDIGGHLLAVVIIVAFTYLVVRWWDFARQRRP